MPASTLARLSIDRTTSYLQGWDLGNINAAWFRLRPQLDAESQLPAILVDRALWITTHHALEIGAWAEGCSLNELLQAIAPRVRDYLGLPA